jgi:hypothetical protein
MGFSMDSNTQSLDFPWTATNDIVGGESEGETCTQLIQKAQSLSNYAQQDLPIGIKRSDF